MTEPFQTGSFRAWSNLLADISRAGSAAQQRNMLSRWLKLADDNDRFCAIRLLAGDTPKKLIARKALLPLHAERSPLPDWLREECLAIAQDPCEAVALLEDASDRTHAISLQDIDEHLRSASRFKADQKAAIISQHWDLLDQESLYQFNRLATGNFSSGMERKDLIIAMADALGTDPHLLLTRLREKNWVDKGLHALSAPAPGPHRLPMPFPEMMTITEPPSGSVRTHSATWMPEGDEAQLVKRNGRAVLWGRELDEDFAGSDELITSAECLPDGTVLYGLVRSAENDASKPCFHVLDVWEWAASSPLDADAAGRRARLKDWLLSQSGHPFQVAEHLPADDADILKAMHRKSRLYQARGILMIPVRTSTDPTTEMIFWPAAAHRIKAVLLYAQRADGTNGPQYSFALARGKEWITVARTGDGLTEDERDELEKFIKANTLQRFGPVRTVKAVQVMELEVDSIRTSTRHKSGYLLEGVRIAAWRKDIGTEMADDIVILNAMKDE